MTSPLRNFAMPLLALFFALPAAGQVVDQLKYSLPVPVVGVQSGGALGVSVAVDGPYTVVGANGEFVGSAAVGVAKVFDSSTGALLFVLPNPSPAASDIFGNAVAISGTKVVVGAVYDDTGATDAGSAYVFDLSSATPTVPIFTLNNPGPTAGGFFGVSVAISGNVVVVGAENNRVGGFDVGSAYVYDLSSGTPTVPMLTLNNPTPVSRDQFGVSVAISGMRVVVGAYQDGTGAFNAGSAYVYDLSKGTPTVPLFTLNNPSPSSYDWFGYSVAISGTRVVVGTDHDDTGATDSGSAYVYDLSGATPTVPVVTLNNPSAAAYAGFGFSVTISGTRVVVGARDDNTGASAAGSAYVYVMNSATPTVPVLTLNNPNPAQGDGFGNAVAIVGARLVVGTPGNDEGAINTGTAYVYDLGGGTPTVPTTTLNSATGLVVNNNFGTSVAVSGNLMIVGAPFEDTGAIDAGSAYVYDLSSVTPTVPIFTLNKPSPVTNDQFAFSVSISGTRAVVGASRDDTGIHNAGSAYVYDFTSATPTVPVFTLHNPSPADGDFFGYAVGISGVRVVVGAHLDDTGATDSGSAYVYDLGGPTPTVPAFTLNNPGPAASDNFGISVAIDGTRIAIGATQDDTGASNAGSTYVYDLSRATPTVPLATLNNPGPAASDQFGNSVAISGARVVVGAAANFVGASSAGSAYVYDLFGATPTVPVATLNNPSPAAFDLFGKSVAISATRVVVGAYGDDIGAGDSGTAYMYDLASTTPTVPVATLVNPASSLGDQLGFSVAIDGAAVAVGAPFDDSPQTDNGSIYVFGPSPYSLWKVSELSSQFAPDLGDADRDGVSNVGEYGLLSSPNIPNGALTSAAPALYAEGTRLRMFIPRDPARNDVTLEVQATGDLLGTWTTIATSTLGAPFSGPGYFGGDSATPGVKSVEVRDTVNLPDAPQRYLRVRVRH